MADRARQPTARPGGSATRAGSGWRGTVKATVRRAAELLPPPRDEALIDVARSAFALVTGRPVARPGASGRRRAAEPFVSPVAWRRARSAFERRDFDVALEQVDAILARHPDSFKALSLRRDILNRRGELTAAVATIHRMRELRDEPRLAAQERGTMGRLVETDPRWLPRIPGPPQPVEPRGRGVVMHLLKESVPYSQNGFTMRSRYTVLSQRDAGLDPFVVTSLGFPRKDGVTEVPPHDVVDGVTYHRLDLGPGYDGGMPFDRVLSDTAWLAARIGRRERPAILHAASGFRGFDPALVGRALREHLRRPLVYEVRSFVETTWSPDPRYAESAEQFRRRIETENRCMLAADAVVTIADAMRDDIASRGIPRERIHVMPNGVDPEAFQPLNRDPELVRRYGLEGKSVFGYVSNLDHPREGQELLIEAASRLLARGRKVVCLIVGDGRRREELEAIARRARVGDAVRFTGRVPHDEVRAHYALLDVFVVPRRNERAARYVTPLKPFEAMAMARPLVVSDLPALIEIAAPGERGLTFAHEDPDALAATIERLIDDPALGRRLGEAGRTWVVRERSWARNGERYREIYEDVLDRWDRGTAR